jgi:zona occludens toxin (predicted ATPase)
VQAKTKRKGNNGNEIKICEKKQRKTHIQIEKLINLGKKKTKTKTSIFRDITLCCLPTFLLATFITLIYIALAYSSALKDGGDMFLRNVC